MNSSKTESGVPSIIVSSIEISKTDHLSAIDCHSDIRKSKTDQRKPSITVKITDSNGDIKTKETWGWKLVELGEDQQWERVNVLLTSISILLILNASLLLYYVMYYLMLSSPKTILVNRIIPRQEIVGKIILLFGDTVKLGIKELFGHRKIIHRKWFTIANLFLI